MLKDGFYTALGTPVDDFGNVIEKSLVRQIRDQMEAGASGLLLLGSMGMEACIKESEYGHIVDIAARTVNGKCHLFAGAMDNSVWRVKEKLAAIGDSKIDGIVITTPYYFVSPQKEIIAYFKAIADASWFPVYLYDLPGVTKIKITMETVLSVIEDRRFAGIKSGDLVLDRELTLRAGQEEFAVLFSNLDLFDAAYKFGIRKNLDGMFSCTPNNAHKCYESLAKCDFEASTKYLDNIISLRNVFAEYGIFPSFTAAMNLLGYEGSFGPDYMGQVGGAAVERITAKLREIGEL